MPKKKKHSNGINVEATGKRIGQLIKDYGFDVKDVSVHMGLSPQAIYKWQEGKALPDVENLYILSKFLGCKMDDFIVANDEEKKNFTFGILNHLRMYYICIQRLLQLQM